MFYQIFIELYSLSSQLQVTDNSDQQETDHVNSQVHVTNKSDQQKQTM